MMCPRRTRWTPMTEQIVELKQRLVVGRKRDGRHCYDPQAKRELIEACLHPGVSVAKLALTHGVNANLLRNWVTKHQRQLSAGGYYRQRQSALGWDGRRLQRISDRRRWPPCDGQARQGTTEARHIAVALFTSTYPTNLTAALPRFRPPRASSRCRHTATRPS